MKVPNFRANFIAFFWYTAFLVLCFFESFFGQILADVRQNLYLCSAKVPPQKTNVL